MLTNQSPFALLCQHPFQNDGKPDLVSANQYFGTISVLRNIHVSGNITSGSFNSKADFPTNRQVIGVAIGDLNGDGISENSKFGQGYNPVHLGIKCSRLQLGGYRSSTKAKPRKFSGCLGQ